MKKLNKTFSELPERLQGIFVSHFAISIRIGEEKKHILKECFETANPRIKIEIDGESVITWEIDKADGGALIQLIESKV